MIELKVDEKELRQIQRDLDRLLAPDRGTKTIVRQAMRKAMKPMVKQLKTYLKKHKDSGALVRSIGLINAKTPKNSQPIVLVGPRKNAKGKGQKLPTGYMYYLEYGNRKESGKRYLDKTLKTMQQTVYSSIVPSLRSIIDKRFKKKGL